MSWPFLLIVFTSTWAFWLSFAQADKSTPMPPDHIRLWLDEVQAQREFLAARRRAAKENANAHLRAIDPWVAERVEAAARESQLRQELANQRHQSAKDERQARMEALERSLPAPPYYVPYPYPCWYYNNRDANATTTQPCQ